MKIPTAVIVDDDPDLVNIFSELLKTIDVNIIGIGGTGKEAIRIVKNLKPDILFLDIHMPELNGVEALKEINRQTPKTHVIIMTSDISVDKNELANYGSSSIIFKPFNMDEIIKVIEVIKTMDRTVVKNGQTV